MRGFDEGRGKVSSLLSPVRSIGFAMKHILDLLTKDVFSLELIQYQRYLSCQYIHQYFGRR